MKESKSERRLQTRVETRQPVTVKSAGGIELTGHTRDLSSSGIFLYLDSKIAAGTEMEMILILPAELTQGEKRWVCCQASVVRVEEGGKDGQVGVAARVRSMDFLPEIMG